MKRKKWRVKWVLLQYATYSQCTYLHHQNNFVAALYKTIMAYSDEEIAFLTQIGSRLRQLRLQQNLSQEELAFDCDLDRTYIGSVERGERNISVLNLKKVTQSLQVPLPQFFDF